MDIQFIKLEYHLGTPNDLQALLVINMTEGRDSQDVTIFNKAGTVIWEGTSEDIQNGKFPVEHKEIISAHQPYSLAIQANEIETKVYPQYATMEEQKAAFEEFRTLAGGDIQVPLEMIKEMGSERTLKLMEQIILENHNLPLGGLGGERIYNALVYMEKNLL